MAIISLTTGNLSLYMRDENLAGYKRCGKVCCVVASFIEHAEKAWVCSLVWMPLLKGGSNSLPET